MTVRIVRLNSPRQRDEGIRIGAIRKPSNGPGDAGAGGDYDVWYPTLAPSMETQRLAQEAKTEAQRTAFARRYRAEMSRPESAQALQLLALMSQQVDFAIGCLCEDEFRCHASVLREMLAERGARFADGASVADDGPAHARVSPPLSLVKSALVVAFPTRTEAPPALPEVPPPDSIGPLSVWH